MTGSFRRLDGGIRDRVANSLHQDPSTSAPAKAIWVSPMETMNSKNARARKTMIATGGSQGIGAGERTKRDRVGMATQEIEPKAPMRPSDRWMLTFRTSITSAVMAFIVALAVLLIAIQARALHLATKEAASAYMDATSAKALRRLQTEITAIASFVRVLATSSGVADSNEGTATGPAIAYLWHGRPGPLWLPL